jgi:hypothetical protein
MTPVAARLILGVALIAGLSFAIPTLTSMTYFNFGNAIRVQYTATDAYDGRQESNKFTSTTGSDWIGLFPKGGCNAPDNIQDRHKCYLATRSVPRTQMSGEVTFEVDDYAQAGDYEIRYFYGDDPFIEGNDNTSPHFTWAGNGYVCNTNAGMEGSVFFLNQVDPTWVSYVQSQEQWKSGRGNDTASDESSLFAPEYDCSCDPRTGTFTEKRQCCLRHMNCVPRMDDLIRVCRQYHDTYLEQDEDFEVSCVCDTSSLTGDALIQCLETRAACLRCALDSVATTDVHVLGPWGLGDTQMSAQEIPGFEVML